MPSIATPPAETAGVGKLKVFLSYSRKDSEFAQELLAALELLGFDAYLDKEDIAPGEPWEERLRNLIRLADTVVFIMSPHSLVSKHCTWEVEETARAAKRLVPVMLRLSPDTEVPERLRKLNYVFFTEGQSFAKGLGDLGRALRADAGWIREHTRYGELASRWAERSKADALLLRGSDLDDARHWIAIRPQDAPEISAVQLAYVEASNRAEEEELAAKAQLRWRVQAGLALASVVLAAVAAFAGLQWRNADEANRSLVVSNAKLERTVGELDSARETLASRNALLDATNARLERRLALRAGPLGNIPYDVPAGWFQIATSYAGSVAFVEQAEGPSGAIMASGVIVSGRQLDPRWSEAPVYLTASYVVAEGGKHDMALPAKRAKLISFGPKNEVRNLGLAAVLWQSDAVGVSVSSLAGSLPEGAIMIENVNVSPLALADRASTTGAELNARLDQKGMLQSDDNPRPIIVVGNLLGRPEVALSISHLLGRLQPNAVPRPGLTRGIVQEPIDLFTDLRYTHVTLPGSGGSPIFDAETGDLIGIHLLSHDCPDQPSSRKCGAGGASITRIIEAIRQAGR